MKRIFLFLATNILIITMIGIVWTLVNLFLGDSLEGSWLGELLVYSLVFGMTGSFVSLLLSKWIAKFSVGAQTITGTESAEAAELVATVSRLATQAGIKMPEVAIYQGSPNAFATGAFKNKALVAVSTELLQTMRPNEIRAVLGHEIGHVANGDMVTLSLLQGVLNAMVLFISRIAGIVIDSAISGKNNRRRGLGIGGLLARIVLQMLLSVFATMLVCAYSRRREFAADASSARFAGSPSDMIAALRRLQSLSERAQPLPDSLKAFGISGGKLSGLFSTHPPLERRIAALEKLRGF